MFILKYSVFFFLLCLNFHSILNLSGFNDNDNTFPFNSRLDLIPEDEVLHRVVRSADLNNNVSLTLNPLNDTHQQLIVHWVGEGSNIIICLARDPKEISSRNRVPKQSSVFYSYDYGQTFEDKSHFFKKEDSKTIVQLDKFYIHPKFSSRTVFVDSTNKMLFVTEDDGKTFTPHLLNFVPNDVSFLSYNHRIFFVHDKSNSSKNLWATYDFGNTWQLLQRSVKSFDWFSEYGTDKDVLIIQREEADGTTIISKKGVFGNANDDWLLSSVNELYVKGDYIFATKFGTMNDSSSEEVNQVLYIKYRETDFIKATFSTDLMNKNFHIADITENRIMVAVGHSNTLCNLYTSDIVDKQTAVIHFTLSLERIFCHFPNITWRESLISGLSDTPFIDLHKVEGLHGIYIASQILLILGNSSSITTEHLATKITFNWGVDWRYLNLTEQITDVPCKLEAGCSLHLTQKFALWYPSARLMPILSTKSAPGLILATGTIGTSMKGHPSVYMSRDAGVTWKQVLKENYYFNIGDHGGIIVAVKFYKNKEEVSYILYSTDEGETWQNQKLTEAPLKVYSLMTEPGENTTVFSLFGSSTGIHQWIIVKADFQKAFPRNCTEDDYKFWSPYNPDEKKMNCLLGRKEVYKRRITSTNCYNGVNFNRPIKMQTCVCEKADFMCDDGFYWDNHTEHCIRQREPNVHIDPYAIPQPCPPYTTYIRTKGYKKIPRDYCEGGPREYQKDVLPCPIGEKKEFLLLAQKERIVTFNLNDPKPEVLPIGGLQNVIAVEFDLHNNCVFYADIVSDVISKWCLSSGSLPKNIVDSRLHSVEGMAYDWVSNHLYFVDGVRSKIEVVRTDTEESNRLRKTIINSTIAKKPRGIAIHPSAGFMFWTDWVAGSPSINRAHLDGSNPMKLFTKPTVEWPNGITVDYSSDRIYWVDAREDYIASSDYNGKGFKKIIERNSKVSHPFSVAVYKQNMYWDDWRSSAIFVADKDDGLGIGMISSPLPGLMDLKIYAHSIQEGTNACANNTYCSHLCFGLPEGKFSCQCPDDLILINNNKCMCPGNIEPLKNGTCPSVHNTCSSNYFRCKSSVCIPFALKCDGDDDCGDNSDEMCDNVTTTCPPNLFRCGNGKCIPAYWKCDYDFDCPDQSDEKDCQYPTCKAGQFSCDNGRCIAMKWHCDNENDCRDGSDERNCTLSNSGGRTCLADEFSCGGRPECIPAKWQCDNERDCPDGSDETNCTGKTCEPWQFQCANKKCIFQTWKCDGDNDCDDLSDEQNCTQPTSNQPTPSLPYTPTNSCMAWMFQCNNKKCIPYWWKCDRINDCSDNSDEIGCPHNELESNSTTSPISSTATTSTTCSNNEFRCNSGRCIMDSWLCDGEKDCAYGEDEKNCNGVSTKCKEKSQFVCRKSGICIPARQVCDGIKQCPDGTDEGSCDINPENPVLPVTCPVGYFHCDYSSCHALHLRCDGKPNCADENDEFNCTSPLNKTYQAVMLKADKSSVDSFLVTWSVMPTFNGTFQFLPSIYAGGTWKNESWISLAYYTFTNLNASTTYNVTVYVRDAATKKIYPPAYYLKASTMKGIPSPPQNVSVRILNDTFIEVKWLPPASPKGDIQNYTLYLTPPHPPLTKSVDGTMRSIIFSYDFEERTYLISMSASNGLFESVTSPVVALSYFKSSKQNITDLKIEKSSSYSVTLSWKSSLKFTTFKINCRVNPPYPSIKSKITNETTFTFTGLSPGVNYVFEVGFINSDNVRDLASVSASTGGTPFPSVSNIKIKLDGNVAHIEWNGETDAKQKWKYAIYYGATMQELFDGPKEITEETSIGIPGLQWCSSYTFDVGVKLQESYGPLSNHPWSLLTAIDPKAPPKDLRVNLLSTSNTRVEIKWNSSCSIIADPIGYRVNIYEINTKASYQITVEKTREHSFMKIFNGTYSSHYNISVVTTEDGAISSEWIDTETKGIPPPYQVVVHGNPNKGFVVFWETNKYDIVLQNITDKFEVAVYENLDEKNAKIYTSKNSPLSITDLKENQVYSFAVRIVTKTGHKSEFSNLSAMNILGSASEEIYKKSESRGYVWHALIIVLLVSGLVGFLYWKRKRSHVSFKNLANSHYNTRSGSTTFTGVNGLDMEDTPEIREHFSDDEPLVIA